MMKNALTGLLLGSLLLATLPACGTLFYRDRGRINSGRIDPNVAILNAVGLLFFVVPGLVAFVVDAYTGALYLPDGVDRGEGPFIRD